MRIWKKNKLQDEEGIALVVTLFFAVMLYAISGIFVLRVVNEAKMARIEREYSKNYYAAQAGARAALAKVDILINTYLQNTISSASPSGVISYAQSRVSDGDGIAWLVYAVRHDNEVVLTRNGDQAEFTQTVDLGDSNYTYTIILTEKEDPSTVSTDIWDFPYIYKIEATSSQAGIESDVTLSGDFTVRVQRDNFAKYALFTNEQKTKSGSNVWFTDATNFDGPLHTNDRFNFALNPSGIFDGLVEQYQQTARFYNHGWTTLLDSDHNGTKDVPTFNAGFNRGVDEVTASSSSAEEDMANQANGGAMISGSGIYVPNDGSSLIGGIYVDGNCSITLEVDANDNAVYSLAQGTTTKNITVDRANNQTTVETVGVGTATYTGIPDGVDDAGSLIYVDGNISSFGGTVQSETEITVASSDNFNITDDVEYEMYNAASGSPGDVDYVPPSVTSVAGSSVNLLGIVSWNGDVEIDTSAPDDINIHGTVYANNGVFTVENYNSGLPRGDATVLGGVITDNYGAFGTFNGRTGDAVSGYGRNFVYDDRMQQGYAPPYFPTLNTFVAFTNDIVDKIVWHSGE